MTRGEDHAPAAASGATSAPRRTTVLAICIVGLWLGVVAGWIALASANRHLHYVTLVGETAHSVDMAFVAVEAAMSMVYALVGTVVVTRTRHVVGWLLLAIAVSFPALGLTEQYALHGLVTAPGSLLWTTAVGLSTLWVAGITTTSITLLLLLFPTGAPRSPRWRWAVRGTIVAALLWAISYQLTPGPFNGPWNDHGVHVSNPLGIEVLGGVLKATFAVGVAASLLLSVAGVVSLVLRFRGSRGVERQQVKLLAYVGLVLAVLFLVQFVLGPVLRVAEDISNVTWSIFFITLMVGIPVSVGAAILRYHLYDIDRIVSRTVSYVIVTVLLGGVFVGLVLIPTLALGGRETPDYVIAIATLVVFGLFRPARRRVQGAVDRRFNRARYDATTTIDAFTSRLRSQTDLDTLGAELVEVVRRTMHPSSASIWVRPST